MVSKTIGFDRVDKGCYTFRKNIETKRASLTLGFPRLNSELATNRNALLD